MVRAILEKRKTQTRRIIKPQPEYYTKNGTKYTSFQKTTLPVAKGYDLIAYLDNPLYIGECPYGEIGQKLWVRETWGICPDYNEPRYKADKGMDRIAVGGKWKPSIFMPKKYARIWLEVTGLKLERLQDISEKDAMAEGISWTKQHHPLGTYNYGKSSAKRAFQELWNSVNKKRGYSWEINPWVWAIGFERIDK